MVAFLLKPFLRVGLIAAAAAVSHLKPDPRSLRLVKQYAKKLRLGSMPNPAVPLVVSGVPVADLLGERDESESGPLMYITTDFHEWEAGRMKNKSMFLRLRLPFVAPMGVVPINFFESRHECWYKVRFAGVPMC
jgi:hypothetical protein